MTQSMLQKTESAATRLDCWITRGPFDPPSQVKIPVELAVKVSSPCGNLEGDETRDQLLPREVMAHGGEEEVPDPMGESY